MGASRRRHDKQGKCRDRGRQRWRDRGSKSAKEEGKNMIIQNSGQSVDLLSVMEENTFVNRRHLVCIMKL